MDFISHQCCGESYSHLFRYLLFDHAGQFRTYNITKNEWVLGGDTVVYSSWESIRDTLDYDFAQEKQFSYDALSVPDSIRHIAKFASGIWQIHPFCEGNTRATAVFIVKYLKTFGFTVNNDVFAANSWYFRNALVRANYNDLQHNVHETTEYLELFSTVTPSVKNSFSRYAIGFFSAGGRI